MLLIFALVFRKHPINSFFYVVRFTLMKTTTMQKAHTRLDRAVWSAYGAAWKSEAECVADLMNRYQVLVSARS